MRGYACRRSSNGLPADGGLEDWDSMKRARIAWSCSKSASSCAREWFRNRPAASLAAKPRMAVLMSRSVRATRSAQASDDLDTAAAEAIADYLARDDRRRRVLDRPSSTVGSQVLQGIRIEPERRIELLTYSLRGRPGHFRP
jgi:hypothetical protein